MCKLMRRFSVALALAVTGTLLLSLPPTASAQRVRQRIIIVQPVDFFPGPYPYYPYPAYNVASIAMTVPETPRRIDITAKRFSYTPDKITLKKDEPVVLVFHTEDVTHGFNVPDLNIKADDIKKDKDSEVPFTPTQSGHFVGKCAHFCGKDHGSMALQIDVVN